MVPTTQPPVNPQLKSLQLLDDLIYILAHPAEFAKQKDALAKMLVEQQKLADMTSENNAKTKKIFQDIAAERHNLEVARGDLVREREALAKAQAETKQGQDTLASARKAFDAEQAARITELQKERTAHGTAKKAFDEEQARGTAMLTQRTREVENRESKLESREAALVKREAAAQAVLDRARKMAELAS